MFKVNGQLEAYGCPALLTEVASKYDTPTYIYTKERIIENYETFAKSIQLKDKLICFAIKANSNIEIIKLLGKQGSGADCVSIGEIKRALAAGIQPNRIIFSGVGKTETEIEFALKNQIHQINIESIPELELIETISQKLNCEAPIVIRFNPNTDAKTHKYLTTGLYYDKFGLDFNSALLAAKIIQKSEYLEFKGLSCHIGSQITDIDPFQIAFKKMTELANQLISEGLKIERIDFGGGIGIQYSMTDQKVIDLNEYGKLVESTMRYIKSNSEIQAIFEPGRIILGNAGCLLTKVLYVKENYKNEKFLIIDAGMNDLMRPALYGAFHAIIPISITNENIEPSFNYTVVGPICESADIFQKEISLPKMKSGDLLIIRNCGAYGMSMANEYNSRPMPAEVLVTNDNQMRLIRRRKSISEIIDSEISDIRIKL